MPQRSSLSITYLIISLPSPDIRAAADEFPMIFEQRTSWNAVYANFGEVAFHAVQTRPRSARPIAGLGLSAKPDGRQGLPCGMLPLPRRRPKRPRDGVARG